MKKKISIFMIVCLASVLFSSLANAGSGAAQIDPNMRVHMPNAVVCLALSKAIQKDKAQLLSVLGYLNTYRCNTEPARSSHRCVSLFKKKAALEARISANQAKARRLGCR